MARWPLTILALVGTIIALTIYYEESIRGDAASSFKSWLTFLEHDSDSSSTSFIGGSPTTYLLGVGKGDITGPVVEINFMGYANASQLGTGLRQRLYSRAFIVGDVESPTDRFVYLVLDTQSGDTAIRHGILEALAGMGEEYAVYGQHNMAVTGTHSHSGPAAWLNYLLPQITSKGFHKQSYQVIVDGAVASIMQAHESLAPGHLSVGQVDLEDTNLNRSPYSYLNNPAEERAQYEHDVDKTLTMLRFTHDVDSGDEDIGVLTWFAVHGTSMLGNNTIVTGDNKGVAAWMFEKASQDNQFVAGFSQSTVGDTTPNVLGAYCEWGEQEGELCDFKTSLCGNKSEPCHGRGPYYGRNDAGLASTFEIGRRQFEGAYKLSTDNDAFTPITGNMINSFHRFVDMSELNFTLSNGDNVNTCPAALGYCFAAGTTDGPGVFDFKQAQPNCSHANPFWGAVSGLISRADKQQRACHAEKVILLDVGESHRPYDWTPNIVDLQFLRVGQFFIIVSPGEATTMAGRRWRQALATKAQSLSLLPSDTTPIVVIGGPANTYSHYITTREEYAIQRYEGASTLYGPHTLDAYIHLTNTYLPYLTLPATSQSDLPTPPSPQINTNRSLTFIRPVLLDRPGFFSHFGDVLTDVITHTPYRAGASIEARFVGANPRNDLRRGGTYAAVEKLVDPSTSRWEVVRDDADWSLVFEWVRTSTVRGTSEVTVRWETAWETGDWVRGVPELGGEVGKEIGDSGESGGHGGDGGGGLGGHGDLVRRGAELKGVYRLRYYGDAKSLGGKISSFGGTSGAFEIE